MLQQTYFLLLNVSFPPCFLSPLLLSLSLSLSLFWGGGGAPGAPPPESAPEFSFQLLVGVLKL